jgi:hypothetical protein
MLLTRVDAPVTVDKVVLVVATPVVPGVVAAAAPVLAVNYLWPDP